MKKENKFGVMIKVPKNDPVYSEIAGKGISPEVGLFTALSRMSDAELGAVDSIISANKTEVGKGPIRQFTVMFGYRNVVVDAADTIHAVFLAVKNFEFRKLGGFIGVTQMDVVKKY